jgi:hypothetical protein
MAALRVKAYGLWLVQCYKNSEVDVLQDRRTKHVINLDEEEPENKRILVLETIPCPMFKDRIMMMQRMIQEIRKKNISAIITNIDNVCTENEGRIQNDAINVDLSINNDKKSLCLIFNEAKITDEERSRLYLRRFGYCDSNLFPRMMRDPDFGELPKLISLNEDNPINDGAKFKKRTHKRTPSSISMGT